MGDTKHILLLTPSAELYGSDRAVLYALPTFADVGRITLVSAADGPLIERARPYCDAVEVTADWALRRKYLRGIGALGMAQRAASSIRALRRIGRAQPFTHIYVNTVACTLIPLLRVVAANAVIVVHVREVPRTNRRFNQIHFAAIASVADVVVCNSTHTAAFVETTCPRLADRIHVIHDGVTLDGDDDQLAKIQARPNGVNDASHLDIVCVGRLHANKGQSVLLEALKAGTDAGHDWTVHLWGDALPEYQADVDALHDACHRLDIADRVQFHGFSSAIRPMYQDMDVAVIPSLWPEGFSLVTAEAQLAGLPAIATGPGGPDDIIVEGITGRVVPFGDAGAVAAALMELTDPEKRTAWGKAAKERAAERFTAQAYAESLAQLVSTGSRRANRRVRSIRPT